MQGVRRDDNREGLTQRHVLDVGAWLEEWRGAFQPEIEAIEGIRMVRSSSCRETE